MYNEKDCKKDPYDLVLIVKAPIVDNNRKI